MGRRRFRDSRTAPWANRIRAIARLVLPVTLLLLAALAALRWAGDPGHGSAPQEVPRYQGARVMVDPGHGGIDGGTGKRTFGLEKDVNLAIGLEVHRLLRAEGVDAALTRDLDVDLGGSGKGSRWRRDLQARLRLTREHQAQAIVSIHANAARDSAEQGPLVFYAKGSVEGERLAWAVLNSLAEVTRPNFSRPIAASFYVLKQSPVPAVLVETGFLTNAADRELLFDADYQKRLAAAIANGVLTYLEGVATLRSLPALNTALSLVQTPYFAQLDADDWLMPRALEQLRGELERQPATTALVSGNILTLPDNGRAPIFRRGQGVQGQVPISAQEPFSLPG